LEKAALLTFGPSEVSLRLVPLAAGVLSLPLFYLLARRLLAPWTAVLALGLLAILDPVVRYSAEVKPYSVDVLAAVALLLALTEAERRQWRTPIAWAFGGLGAVLVWTSFPATFVVGGIAAALLLRAGLRRRLPDAVRYLPALVPWVASFGVFYVVSLRAAGANPVLAAFWGGSFMPFPPTSFAAVDWLVTHLTDVFENPLGFAPYSGAAVLFVLGGLSLARSAGLMAGSIGCLVAATLAASAIGKYPFRDRLLLFLVPGFLLLIAEGVAWCARWMKGSAAWVSALLTVLLLFEPLHTAYLSVADPLNRDDLRPVMEQVVERYQPGDTIYVYYNARPAFLYYSYLFRFTPSDVRFGTRSRERPEAYLNEIDPLLGMRRVWFIFSHDFSGSPTGGERRYVLRYLRCEGTLMDEVERTGAAVDLFDLSAARAPADCRP